MKLVQKIGAKGLISLTNAAVRNQSVRKFLLKQMENKMFADLVKGNPDNRPIKVQEDKYYMGRALIRSIDRGIKYEHLSKQATKGLLDVFLGNVFFGGFYMRRDFLEKYGYRPPLFMTISPGKLCNLRCTGCYAASGADMSNKLPYNVLDRIIREASELWGMNFFVISGGEPLMYKDEGKTILDLFEKYNKSFFLMYTNGTLIKEDVAKRMAELGNVTPSISVEGLEKETDERRGKGVFKAILRAMANLRKSGVPFGISVTATTKNIDAIMSDEFVRTLFDEQGALYGWIFQYMPIGREYTLNLMPTPEQRMRLFNWEWHLVRNRDIFLADFWNSATSSDGCIAGARSGGYFYIDWDGDVMPCVFVPYSADNIVQIYESGGTLNDALNSPFFKAIRAWQDDYGYNKPPEEHGNWIRPCFIRDHHDIFLETVKKNNARPIDKDSMNALHDRNYHRGLVKYDEEMEKLSGDLWREHYLKKEKLEVKR